MGGDSLSVPILYETNATDFNNLGLGPLVDTTVATVTEERNGQFILEMQYPVDGIRASLIAKNRILKVDAGHKLKDQRFVIKRINRIMGNDGLSYSIYTEHISYITADYALKPNLTVNGSGNVAMTQWLNGIIDSNRIHVDSDITTENTTSWTIDKVQNARQALGGVQGSILDVWGGEYRFDNLNISLLRHRGTVSNTMLSYGRNITDFDQEENITNTYTSIYPFASYSVQNGDTSEQKILTIPDLVVDSEYVNNFPNRKIQVVDFSDKFSTDEKPTVERLAELAKSYIKNNNVGVPTVSTKISFVDLSKTENYKEFAPLEELDLCDEVPFAFEKFGIKTTAKISRIVWNVLLDSYDSLELGELKTNLSDVINNTNNAALDAKDAANDAKNSADNAALSANGKNRNWYGADDPAFGHLSELREGDSWYKPNGEDTELYYWENGQWVFILSTKDTHEAKDAADAAQKEAEEAKKQVNESVATANDAVAKAGFANDTADQAKSDAAAAGQQAKDALTSAGTAITDAQKALTNSSSAMADSAQARKDSAAAAADAVTAKGQAANALGQANTAINNAANALDKFNNLQVGGRNLLSGTNQGLTNWTFGSGSGGQHVKYAFDVSNGKGITVKTIVAYTNYFWIGYKLNYQVLKQNTDYVLSFWVKSTDIDRSLSASFSTGDASKSSAKFGTVRLKAGVATKVVLRATTNDVNFSGQYLYLNSFNMLGGIDIWDLQLVEGTSALDDWSPAPEDIQVQITNINGELSQKVSQTDYDNLKGTVTSQGTTLTQTVNDLKSKAGKTTVDTINKTVEQQGTELAQNSHDIQLKADSSTVNTIKGTVDSNSASIKLANDQIDLKANQTDVDTINKTVNSNTAAIGVNTNSIKLKADKSTVDSLTGRVSTAEGKLTVQADKIAQTVSKTELNSTLSGYATQTWTQSQIKSTADSINLSVSKVQNNLDNLAIGGRNYLADTSTPWQMQGSGGANQNSSWLFTFGAINQAPFKDGEYVTVSFDYTSVGTGAYGAIFPQFNGTPWSQFNGGEPMKDNGHVVRTVQWQSDWTTSGTATGIRIRIDNVATTRTVTVYNMQFERGNKDTDHKAAPEDMATVEKLSELQVTVNGIQGTVQNKADQSQVTQLAGQITSVVGDVSANGSQITQMKADINLRVKAGDVVNQINISPESILIAGQKVHITGQTSIDNAVIKDAMIANVTADKITAGTLNAANVNVINLNANNITAGTIRGANLAINLNTGEVTFQKGRIHSASNNIDINIDQGYVSVANDNARVMMKNGGIQFVQPNIFDDSTNPYLSISNGGSGLAFTGARIVGRDYIVISNSANSDNIFDRTIGGAETFAGISVGFDGTAWHPTKIGGAERGIILSAGLPLSTNVSFVGSPASIRIGSAGSNHWNGNRIELTGEYVHIISAYRQTASGGPNVIVTQDGALVRSTSASKYKTDIIRANATDYGDKLLNLPTATWTDIAETKRYRDDPVNQIKPTRNFGMIAEDLAEAGLEMLVVRGADGELEGINYDRIGPALIPVIARLKNEVELLKQKLEGKTA